jgi:hypothetical protein
MTRGEALAPAAALIGRSVADLRERSICSIAPASSVWQRRCARSGRPKQSPPCRNRTQRCG